MHKADRVFEVVSRVGSSGEYILGYEDTGSHACYLIYGRMKPHEKGRLLKPGRGHEELILAIEGEFSVTGAFNTVLKQGQAIHLKEEQTCYLENLTDREAVYVIAGGHSEGGHH